MTLPPYLSDDPAALASLARVEILYTDLDGTMLAKGGVLLADASGAPSVTTVQAVAELNRNGLKVVPVSGRGRVQMVEFVRLLDWYDFIGEVGGLLGHGIGTPDRSIVHNIGDWSTESVPEGSTPLEVIDSYGVLEALQAAFPGQIEHHSPWHEGREATHLLRGCIPVADGQRILDDLGAPVDLVDNGMIHPRAHTLTCTEHIHAFHLVPKGVNKAQAIALDLASRGLEPSQAMAIGDSAADLSMADAVGLMVMVANAVDSPTTREMLEAEPRARLLHGARGDGWAELARVWVAARRSTAR